MQQLTAAEIHEVIAHILRSPVEVSHLSIRPISGWTTAGMWVCGVQTWIIVTDLSAARQVAADLHLQPRTGQRGTWAGWSCTSSGLRVESILQIASAPWPPATMTDGPTASPPRHSSDPTAKAARSTAPAS